MLKIIPAVNASSLKIITFKINLQSTVDVNAIECVLGSIHGTNRGDEICV